ncbi:ComF family protein [Polaromonas sp. A23]|uniref:ComF family protein n=1 Tax=Polaromonas sp. A23 TaxID=1944133 RepID=UPI000984ECA2|nr:ComF family protein [Polaromonas sp. A23]OOG40976.1 phosphoribosyltransferase [Polaromonas sp. A23]
MLKNLASQCAVCHSWPARRICTHCEARFAKPMSRCRTCALALVTGLDQCGACVRQPPPLDACFAAVTYAYPWPALIADYKFGQDPAWAGVFAKMLLNTPEVADSLNALQRGDWLLPIPLSSARLETRGFNQAWELVKAIGNHGARLSQADARLLLRIKNTPPQSQLKREARLRNVKGAFVVDPLRVPELKGRRVLLVDDVMTSGASLFAAAQALREAGAAVVTAVVIARTE